MDYLIAALGTLLLVDTLVSIYNSELLKAILKELKNK